MSEKRDRERESVGCLVIAMKIYGHVENVPLLIILSKFITMKMLWVFVFPRQKKEREIPSRT